MGKDKNRELMKGTAIYAIGSFGTKILSFLFVPLYTYYVSTSDMGVYDLIITTVSLLVPILTMQIGDAAYRWLIGAVNNADSDGRISSDEEKTYILAAYRVLLLNLLISLIIMLGVYALSGYRYMGYFALILLGSSVFNTVQKFLRGVKNQKLFAGCGIVYTIVLIMMNILQICVLKRGLEGLLLSSGIAYIAASLSAVLLEKRIRINPVSLWKNRPTDKEAGNNGRIEIKSADRKNIKALSVEMIKYALPLIPNQLNWWVMSSSDRYIVRYFIGNEANGIYSISYKFATMLQSVLTLFTNSWQDVSIADTDEDQGEYYSKVFDSYSVFVFGIVMLAIPLSKMYIEFTMSSAYKEASAYVAFLLLGCAFQSFSAYFGAGYLKNKDTKGASMTSIYGALVNITVNILLIRWLGLQAAAISTAAGFFLMWIMRVIQTRNTLKIKLNLRHLFLYGGLAFLMALLQMVISGMQNTGLFTGSHLLPYEMFFYDLFTLFISAGIFLFSNRGLLYRYSKAKN